MISSPVSIHCWFLVWDTSAFQFDQNRVLCPLPMPFSSQPKHPHFSVMFSPPLGHLPHNLLCSSHHKDMLCSLGETKRISLAPGHSIDLSIVKGSSLRPPDLYMTAARAGKDSLWLTGAIQQNPIYSFSKSTGTKRNRMLLLVFSNTRWLFSRGEAAVLCW